jgi:hypothetical protein
MFKAWHWPEDATEMLRASIFYVQAFKASMAKYGGAPKTINRRISSLSSFCKFLAGAATGSCGCRSPCPMGALSFGTLDFTECACWIVLTKVVCNPRQAANPVAKWAGDA